MLKIDMEFRKGILFIRLNGELIKSTISKFHKEVTKMIQDNGIRNIVFNISNLKSIDQAGLEAIYKNYTLTNLNDGQTFICDDKIAFDRIKSRFIRTITRISNELDAIELINI